MKRSMHLKFCVTSAFFLLVNLKSMAIPFSDSFDSHLDQWITNGLWGLTAESYRSPPRCVTDSPGTYYTNNAETILQTANGISLATAIRPALRFYARYSLEQDFDYCWLEVSTNGGSSWTPLGASTGEQTAWTRYQIDLEEYAGAPDFRFRFRMQTDDSVVKDGVYIDDLYLGERPPGVSNVWVAASQTQAQLFWTPSTASDFAFYRIYRALGTNPPEEAFVPLADIPNIATTAWIDIAVSPKTHYKYAVSVFSTNDLESQWFDLPAFTPAGMDYPFLDNGEGGVGLWMAVGGWALSTNLAFSGERAWTDSPGDHYTNNLNIALTLVAPLNLSSAARPV